MVKNIKLYKHKNRFSPSTVGDFENNNMLQKKMKPWDQKKVLIVETWKMSYSITNQKRIKIIIQKKNWDFFIFLFRWRFFIYFNK